MTTILDKDTALWCDQVKLAINMMTIFIDDPKRRVTKILDEVEDTLNWILDPSRLIDRDTYLEIIWQLSYSINEFLNATRIKADDPTERGENEAIVNRVVTLYRNFLNWDQLTVDARDSERYKQLFMLYARLKNLI